MTVTFVAGLVLSGLVGASLGLLGAGGSIVMLPVLVYVVGVDPHAAVPLSLAIVGATSLASVAFRHPDDGISWRTASFFGGAALVGAYFGSRLTHLVPGPVLLLLFGALLVVVGLRIWRDSPDAMGSRTAEFRPAVMMAAGLSVGTLTGFLGVGGGFLIVPALMRVRQITIGRAMNTSLVVIVMSSVSGLAAHALHGDGIQPGLAVPLTGAALVGTVLGIRAARQLHGEHLRRGFAAFVGIAGAVLVIANAASALRLLP